MFKRRYDENIKEMSEEDIKVVTLAYIYLYRKYYVNIELIKAYTDIEDDEFFKYSWLEFKKDYLNIDKNEEPVECVFITLSNYLTKEVIEVYIPL